MLLALGALALPAAIASGWRPPVEGTPVLWLIGLPSWSLGLPFPAIAVTALVLQRWSAATGRRRPYFLSGARNLASVLALLSCPLLIEPTRPSPLRAARGRSATPPWRWRSPRWSSGGAAP